MLRRVLGFGFVVSVVGCSGDTQAVAREDDTELSQVQRGQDTFADDCTGAHRSACDGAVAHANDAAVPSCGGPDNHQCPDGFACIDDASDDCSPPEGDVGCSGLCIPEDPEGDWGDESGAAAPDPNSCEDACGGPSLTGSCGCDELCVQRGDCCPDVDIFCDASADEDREPTSGVCIRSSGDACTTDADCMPGGCGGELCFNPENDPGITSCDCKAPDAPEVTGCGCVAGSCSWYR